MPQFDASVFSTQIIWLLITFVAMYLLMARVVLPRIGDVLEERDHKINDSLRKADLYKEDAEEAYAAYEKTMAEARAETQEIIRGVRERVAAEAAERNAALGENLAAQASDAEARIDEERKQAASKLADAAAEIATQAVERLTGLQVEKAAAEKAVAAAGRGGAR